MSHAATACLVLEAKSQERQLWLPAASLRLMDALLQASPEFYVSRVLLLG